MIERDVLKELYKHRKTVMLTVLLYINIIIHRFPLAHGTSFFGWFMVLDVSEQHRYCGSAAVVRRTVEAECGLPLGRDGMGPFIANRDPPT